MLQDLYRDLGLDKKATPDQVKRAYHRKAKGSHPDTGGDAEQFARVKRAYDVLSDPKRRLTYDKTGHAEDPAPDNDHVKAMEIIASLVEHFIAGTDETVFAVDLVQVMRQELSQMRGRCHTQLFQAQRKIARAEKLAKRFRARGVQRPRLRKNLAGEPQSAIGQCTMAGVASVAHLQKMRAN